MLHIMGCTLSKMFCLVSPQSLGGKSWSTSRCFLAKLRWALFLLISCLFHVHFFNGRVMNTGLNWDRWGLQFFGCCCGVCCDLLNRVISWGNFGRLSTPGKVHHCSMFLPFVDNGCHCCLLRCQYFRNSFKKIPQTDRSQLLCLSFIPEFLWIAAWCLAFENCLVYFTLSGKSYLRDFFINIRSGSTQAWVWLGDVISLFFFNKKTYIKNAKKFEIKKGMG